MQHFFTIYSNDTFIGKGKTGWKKFGISQFVKLMNHIGLSVTPELLKEISDRFIYEEHPNNHLLGVQGEKMLDSYYLISGTIKTFSTEDSQDNNIAAFYMDGAVVTSSNSYLMNEPSLVNYITCSECKVLKVPQAEFLELSNRFPEFKSILVPRLLLMLSEYQKKVNRMLHMKTDERLTYVYEHFPQLFQYFRLKDISSFTGMKPETISRKRKKMSKGIQLSCQEK